MRLVPIVALLACMRAFAAEKPTLTYKAPPSTDDDRPVITQVVFTPQGTDYALKIQFDKAPWGESCRSRCANATLFLDTDNNRSTGLKLADPKAQETGADLAVTIQGSREFSESSARAALKVKVTQYGEEATAVDQGSTLAELSPSDGERVLSDGNSLYLLIDTSIGSLPTGAKVRVVYHPPDSPPISGIARGMSGSASSRVEIFKQGKLSNPVKPK